METRDPLGVRCVKATEQGSQLRALVEAVFHISPRLVPAFADNAIISEDGYVMADFKDKAGRLHRLAVVCDVEDLVSNFRGLAEHMKLDDEDCSKLFDELRFWIAVDYRAAGKAPLK